MKEKKLNRKEKFYSEYCSGCGADVVKGKFGAYCTGKCGMNVGKALGVTLSDAQVKSLLQGKKMLVKGLKGKKGSYDAYLIPEKIEEFSYTKDRKKIKGFQYKFKMEFPQKIGKQGQECKRYYGIVKYKFVKSNKYIENVKEKILLENKDTIEWISINREGVKYVVNVTPRVISNRVSIDKPSNIVSKKDALIKYLVVTGGSSVKEVNDVVKKGEVIISGDVIKFNKVVGTTRSKGKVFGEVWYTVNISIPFKHVIYEKTGETINHIYLDIFGHKFTLVGHYITNNSINEVSVLVDKPYLFFKLMKESKELYNYKEVNLNSESAFKEALERADKSISNKLDTNEYIIERKVLKKDVFSSKIDIELFYRVYENIGEEKEITLESEQFMIKSTFFEVLDTTWPTLVIFLTIIILLRVFTILNTSKKFILHEELLLLLFITYILFLFELVTSRDVYMNGTNLVPFREMFRYPVGSENFNRQVIGNILLFMPFGFFATYYTKIKKISSISFMSILVSLTIEVVQKYIGRSFDVDDIILNVVGGILGFLVYIGLDAIRKKLPSIFQKDGFYNFLSILLVIIICLYLFGIISFG